MFKSSSILKLISDLKSGKDHVSFDQKKYKWRNFPKLKKSINHLK